MKKCFLFLVILVDALAQRSAKNVAETDRCMDTRSAEELRFCAGMYETGESNSVSNRIHDYLSTVCESRNNCQGVEVEGRGQIQWVYEDGEGMVDVSRHLADSYSCEKARWNMGVDDNRQDWLGFPATIRAGEWKLVDATKFNVLAATLGATHRKEDTENKMNYVALARLPSSCGVGLMQWRQTRSSLSNVLQGEWKMVSLQKFDVLQGAMDVMLRIETIEGHSGQLVDERKLYVALARLPFVKHICEIGFNAGHSASLWLLANPTAKVTMFDIWTHEYAEKGEMLLRGGLPEGFGLKNVDARLNIIKGSSHDTLKTYAATHPKSCDIVSVDGDHSYDGAIQDMLDVLPLMRNEESVLLLDDTNCLAEWCIDDARDKMVSDGHYEILLRLKERQHRDRGVTVLRQKAKWTPSAPIMLQVTMSRGWSDIVKCDSVPRSYYSSGSWVHHTVSQLRSYFESCAGLIWIRLNSGPLSDTQTFIDYVLPHMSKSFALVTTDGDNTVPSGIRGARVLLDHPLLERWYTQNYDGTLFLSKLQPFPIGLDNLARKQDGVRKTIQLTSIQMVRYLFSPEYYMFFPFPEILVYEPPSYGKWFTEFVDHVDAHGYLCNLTDRNIGMVCALPGAPKKVMYSYSLSCCMLDSTCSPLCCDKASNPSMCDVRAANIRRDASVPRDRTMKKAKCAMDFADEDKNIWHTETIHLNLNFHPQNTAIEVCLEQGLSVHHCNNVVIPDMVKLWLKGKAYRILKLKTTYN